MGVRVLILTGYGINADLELKKAFEMCGAQADRIHIKDLFANPELLKEYHIAGFAGGFSFGDHLGSGIVYGNMVKKNLKSAFDRFIADGKAVIGICNGFQVLVKMGFLPNTEGNWEQEVSLIHNNSGVFENSWVRLKANQKTACVWTQGLDEFDIPIRHGEGRFIYKDDTVRKKMQKAGLVALTYCDRNPNGSEDDVAGITDTTGRILGLMPHPEAFIFPENHPKWKRKKIESAEGLKIIQNGVSYALKNLAK